MKTLPFSRSRLMRVSFCATLAVLALSLTASEARADRSRVSWSVGFNVPRGGHEFHHHGHRYYAHHGRYYRWDRGRYHPCPAPRGYRVRYLPRSAVSISFGRDIFFRTDHVFYRRSGAHYEVVESPRGFADREIGAPISTPARSVSPAATKLVAVWDGDQRYLLDDGQFFKLTSQGRVWVETPLGALTEELPIGAITIWHEENEYFEFDGAYFRRSPDGFKVVTAPWEKSKPALPEGAET